MAEPPERRQPDRYDALRALENANGEKPKEETSKPVETAQDRSTGGPQSGGMRPQQQFINEYNKDAQAHMQRVHAGGKQPQTNERDVEWKATESFYKNLVQEATMDGKTGDTKAAAATETKSKDQIAREELARGIAAEKQNTGQKENTKGKERGDD